MQKQTIIFDVDGTLLDTERVYTDSWLIAGPEFGYEITRDVPLRTRGFSVEASEKLMKEIYGADFPFQEVRAARIRISEEQIRKKTAEELLKPYVKETLEELKNRGYQLAVATSSESNVTRNHLVYAGIFHYFSAIVSGDMIKRGKPHPDIFLKAAELCHAAPETCIAVGDSPADVESAHAAGMAVILVPDLARSNDETKALCFKVLDNFEHLTETVEALNR